MEPLNVIVLDNGFVVDTQNNKRFLFSVTIISNKEINVPM